MRSASHSAVRGHLASLVDDWKKHGRQIAIVSRSGLRRRAFTYEELAQLSRRFAALLVRHGIAKGERVLLWGANSAEWVAAFFGCVLRGILPVPLDDAGSAEFAARVVGETAPRLIVTSAAHARQLGIDVPVVLFEEFAGALPEEAAATAAELSAADPLQIIFTSGTTGEPQGIVHTHGNVLASLLPIEQEIGRYRRYERIFHPLRFLHTLPLSHVFGQFMGLWIPPLIAAEVHFEDRLIASEIVVKIKEERISAVAAVPRLLEVLREHVRQRYPDLEDRRKNAAGASAFQRWWAFRDIHRLLGLKFWAFICGGAALPGDLEEFWNSLGFVVVQGYGMTETTALVSLNHPFRASSGTLGQVLPGREIKMTEEGEVLVRGATVSHTVWRNGELRERESEWLPTGDLAEIDAAGNLRFRGRKKDVIVTAAGLNIYPEDLEAALLRQPEVKAAAVVESEGNFGPEPLPVLVLRTGSAEDAVGAANRSLAEYQRMQRWFVWPEPDLPRTSTGKVLRREVARVVKSSGERAAAPQSVASLLRDVDASNSEGELNLDSLARVELQAGIEEQYGVTVDDQAIQNVRTVADLQAAIRGHSAPQRDAGDAFEADLRHIYPKWPWTLPVQFCRAVFMEIVLGFFVYFLGKPRVKPTPPAPLGEGPFLLYANHVTAVDPALVLYALPGRIRRRTAIAMSAELIMKWRNGTYYKHWFLNWISPLEYLVVTALFNIFPLPQTTGFRRSFAHAAEAMDRGYNVLVFPEGHLAANEIFQPFRKGAGLLWNELNCPAVPVFLGGLGVLKRTGERWFRSEKLSVVVGQPLRLAAGTKPEAATAQMEAALRALAEPRL